MADRNADEASIAPRRTLSGPSGPESDNPSRVRRQRGPRPLPGSEPAAVRGGGSGQPAPPNQVRSGRTRTARLRLVQVDPWSVTKIAFLLSIAIGVVTVVAVAIVWSVLGASGLWDSVNSSVQQSLGDQSGTPFDVEQYLGTSRVLGFAMVVAVIDVVLVTVIAALGAFLYNLAATLLGGVEVTFSEDQ